MSTNQILFGLVLVLAVGSQLVARLLKVPAIVVLLPMAAAAESEDAKDANQRADNYTLAVVLFASSLFFAGLSIKLDNLNSRIALLGLGVLLFVGTAIWLATMPTQLSV